MVFTLPFAAQDLHLEAYMNNATAYDPQAWASWAQVVIIAKQLIRSRRERRRKRGHWLQLRQDFELRLGSRV
jgi:hypothetical protein